MGDRGNIVVKQWGDAPPVWLYTHWGGSELHRTLQYALRRRLRWDDPSYLTRIIFCVMVADDVNGEIGYGISTQPPDNEHSVLEVDPKEKTVALRRYAWKEKEKPLNEWEVAARWTFEEFCALNLDEIYIDALDPEHKD